MFSDQLKLLRNEMGLSQRELCKILCVSSGAIAMWETDKRQPDIATLCKLADYFNVSIDYLLGRTEEKSPIPITQKIHGHGDVLPRTVPLDQLTEEEQELIEKYRKLAYGSKLRVEAYTKVLLEQQEESDSILHQG